MQFCINVLVTHGLIGIFGDHGDDEALTEIVDLLAGHVQQQRTFPGVVCNTDGDQAGSRSVLTTISIAVQSTCGHCLEGMLVDLLAIQY